MKAILPAVLLLLPLLAAAGNAQRADRPDRKAPPPAPVHRTPEIATARMEAAPLLPDPAGDRGQQCAEQAKSLKLEGNDYRHHVIRCKHR